MNQLTRNLLFTSLVFIGFAVQSAHAALTEADAVSPILESATLVNGSYELTGSMPSGSETPDGGFKTILNGSPLTDVSDDLDRTLSDLDISQIQCFQLQARWTQFEPIKFRSSNKICVNPVIASSPVLDKVTLQSGEYILTGYMPANSGTPAGGYKTILNGEPLTDVSPQLNRTKTGLDTSIRQCFRLQGRWTQFDPIEFLSSDEICIDPISDSRALEVFSSGFEFDVSPDVSLVESDNRRDMDIRGQDTATGYDWERSLEEALPYVQEFSFNNVAGVHRTNFKIGLVGDPVDPDNNVVIALENIEPVADSDGGAVSRPQGTLSFNYEDRNPDVSIYEFSVALDVFLDEEGFDYAKSLNSRIGGDDWFNIFEIWEHRAGDSDYDPAGRSRVSVYLEKDAGSNKPLYFRAVSQKTPSGGSNFVNQWSVGPGDPGDYSDYADYEDVEVPVGRWFTLKAYFKAGGPQDGRFRMSIVDYGVEQIVLNVNNATRDNENPTAPSGLTAMKNYASQSLMEKLGENSFKIYYDNYRFYEGELQ